MEGYEERFYDEHPIRCGECGACDAPPEFMQPEEPIGKCQDGAGWVYLGEECRL